jgi:hypothetical protein
VDLRTGLDLVARALLERETIDGAEVHRLLRLAAQPPETAPEAVAPGVDAAYAPLRAGDDDLR